MKIPASIPDLQQLYERTLELSDTRHAITGALGWVDQILPMFAPACRQTLAIGSIETIEQWLRWVHGDPVLLAQAGKGPMFRWRHEWLGILLRTTLELKHDKENRTPDGRREVAERLWTKHSSLSACFPQAFWQDLTRYLCAPREDEDSDLRHANANDMQHVWFPLVLSEPVVDAGNETNIILAEFVFEIAPLATGSVFLHPEQAAVRCMEDNFSRIFEQAALVARSNLGRPAVSLPDVRVRIVTVDPAHERFLNGTLLQGPSGAGALALGLHCLYTREHRGTEKLAVSFALNEGHETSIDGSCHAVEGTTDKIRGCARMGVRSLLVAKEQEDSLARYGHIQGVEVIGVTTFAQAVETLRGLTTTQTAVRPTTASRKIALLYKRHREPDETLSKILLTQLSNSGYEVFIDRQLPIGIRWAQEIEQQIRTADAVVLLLSEGSVNSEMFQYEVEAAHKAAGTRAGRPIILPVRVRFEDPLTASLASILDPIQSAPWESAEDNLRLVRQIISALENPSVARPITDRARLEPPFGVVPLDSSFYITRSTDDEFNEAITRGDSIVLVRGPRQIGKTSLLARGLRQARDNGARVVWMDLQKLNAAQLASPEALYLTLAEALADQLDLAVFPETVWSSSSGPNINFERYLKREVLSKIDTPLVWALDEVDRLFDCSFKDETFGLFRAWHNQRAFDPSGMWGRLSLVMAYATEAHLFITDLNQSPFNVGTRLTLQDLTEIQIAELNARYDSPLRDELELHEFSGLVGGNPYLVRRGLHEMKARNLSLEAIKETADRDDGPFGDHLHRVLASLAHNPKLLEVMRGVILGEPRASEEDFYRLRSAGVVTGKSAAEFQCRCRLYERYLRKHIL